MGVLNCTPDSFSDGGLFLDEHRALKHAESMLARGASIIDVGAESARPRAAPVPADEQIARAMGIVRRLVKHGATVSIDTTSPAVAARALDEGAVMINTVDLRPARELAIVARERHAMLVLSHSRGSMAEMRGFSEAPETAYGDVVADVKRELSLARDVAVEAGLSPLDILLDPGLGFHKRASQSLALCARLDELVALGHFVLVGPSRKSFLSVVTAERDGEQAAPGDRLGATIAACLACAAKGAAVLRVHDVAEVRQALAFDRALSKGAGDV